MCQTSARGSRGSAFSSANPDFPGAVAFIVTITSFYRMLLDVGSISERQKNTLSFTLSLRTLWRICSSGYFLSAMSNEGRRWPIIAIATVLLNLLIFLESGQNFERAVAEYERLAAAYPAQKESLLALFVCGANLLAETESACGYFAELQSRTGLDDSTSGLGSEYQHGNSGRRKGVCHKHAQVGER